MRTLLNIPGIQVNANSQLGVTPMHLACKNGHAGVVTVLAAAGTFLLELPVTCVCVCVCLCVPLDV